jgi:hypothetical protein
MCCCGCSNVDDATTPTTSRNTSPVEPEPMMTIDPPETAPGAQISVTFDGPQRTQRGAYYVIRDDGADVAILWSDKLEPSSGPGYDLSLSVDILDVGVTATTPDLLVVPGELRDGRYELCTLNTAVPACAPLLVSS